MTSSPRDPEQVERWAGEVADALLAAGTFAPGTGVAER